MYNVSENYITAMQNPVQRFRLRGTIGQTAFTESNVLAGSFSITNQCTDNQNIQIGQVYVGQLDATFVDLDLSRYSSYSLTITAEFGMEISEGVYEYIPLGVFYIAKAQHTASGLVVTAYDAMSKLDKPCSVSESTGTLTDFLDLITLNTGIAFSNRSDVVDMPNGADTYTVYTENDIETWRDLLSWVAQTVGANAIADRSGGIVLKQYNQNVVFSAAPEKRFDDGSFSDYVTKYSGISLVGIADGTTKYCADENDIYLTYNLGSNPLLQYGVANERRARNILDSLHNVEYVPFSVSLLGNPAFDLMDVISFPGGLGDSTKLFCITQYDWTFGRSYRMSGAGQNPSLATARSKTDKTIIGLMGQTEGQSMKVYNYQNANAYHIADGEEVQIVDQYIGATKNGTMMFFAEILNEVLQNPTVTVRYVYDNNELPWYPSETYAEGNHILNLFYPFISEENTVKRLQIFLSANGGSVDIAIGDIRATLIGQGIIGDGVWDGTIDVGDEITLIPLDFDINIVPFTDSAELETMLPVNVSLNDNVNVISLGNDILVLDNITGNVYINKTIMRNKTWGQISSLTWSTLKDGYLW